MNVGSHYDSEEHEKGKKEITVKLLFFARNQNSASVLLLFRREQQWVEAERVEKRSEVEH